MILKVHASGKVSPLNPSDFKWSNRNILMVTIQYKLIHYNAIHNAMQSKTE